MKNKKGLILSLFTIFSLIVVILVGIYQYFNVNTQLNDIEKENKILVSNNKVMKEEIEKLNKQVELNEKSTGSNEEKLNIDQIKTEREKLHNDIDKTIEQFLKARYEINDKTKDKRYEMAKEVTTEKALDENFEKAIQSITPETKLKEYSKFENYKSYIALDEVNSQKTYALAEGTQKLQVGDQSGDRITNFLFKFELTLENDKWLVNDITVKDISLYGND